jgi:hypothetical protein
VKRRRKLHGGYPLLYNSFPLLSSGLAFSSCRSHHGEYFLYCMRLWEESGDFDYPINRWLVNQGRDDEALAVLSKARNLPPDHELVRIEFL